MTPDRQAELARLLDEPQRLRTDFPKAAEYLDVAPGLPGTGNPDVDAAFDLRLVDHLTTTGQGDIDAYWRIVEPCISRRGGRRVVDGGSPEGSARLAYAQVILQDFYAYAIPSPESVDWIRRRSAGLPIVELGAGRGYWACQIAKAGIPIKAYDVAPPNSGKNMSVSSGQESASWYEVQGIDEYALRLRSAPDIALMLCWPPGWGDPMASQALDDYERAGGRRLLYVGEPKGGKTGDDPFFAALTTHWELDSVDHDFVSWWNLSDVAQVWVRP